MELDGTLRVSLAQGYIPSFGDSFDVLDWGSGFLNGVFSVPQLPTLTAGLDWNTSQLYTTGVVCVSLSFDFNSNSVVDAADFVVWRKGLGTTYTQNDYNL